MKERRSHKSIDVEIDQNLICKKYGADFLLCKEDYKIGISQDAIDGIEPIHGMRHPSEGNTTGWYIWSGKYSDNSDFFKPLHVYHLEDIKPDIIKYLGLAAGWRFMYAENHEDVWFDETLLIV